VIAATVLGDEAALERLRALGDLANSAIARAIAKLCIDLQKHVQQDKLSGQVLAVRSGALKSSINVATDQKETRTTATVYTNLDYATAQEYGFSGTVNVRASLRQIKEAFGRPIVEKTIAVHPHDRHMTLPERSFLRSALDDITADISAGVEDALREAIA
jgi:phage gpG-like protein